MNSQTLSRFSYSCWQRTASETVRLAKTYLTTIITRLCIDHLRSARVQREQYVGTWLPEPMLTQQSDNLT